MEQGQEVREQEQEEAVVDVDKEEAAREVVVGVKVVVAEAKEEVLGQDRAVTASVLTVAREQLINWGLPAMISNVLSAERP